MHMKYDNETQSATYHAPRTTNGNLQTADVTDVTEPGVRNRKKPYIFGFRYRVRCRIGVEPVSRCVPSRFTYKLVINSSRFSVPCKRFAKRLSTDRKSWLGEGHPR